MAREADCGGRGGCFHTGDFRSDDGRVTRSGVGMATGSKIDAVGDEARAVEKCRFRRRSGPEFIIAISRLPSARCR